MEVLLFYFAERFYLFVGFLCLLCDSAISQCVMGERRMGKLSVLMNSIVMIFIIIVVIVEGVTKSKATLSQNMRMETASTMAANQLTKLLFDFSG